MEGYGALLVGFMELTFVMVALCLLHRLRKVIGEHAFVMLFGTLLVLGQFLSAAQIELRCGSMFGFELSLPLGIVAVVLPSLASLLLVYTSEGALTTQRLIIGLLAALGMFYYVCKLTQIQSDWVPYSLSAISPGSTLKLLLDNIFSAVAGTVIALLLAVFMMPALYTFLRRKGVRLYPSLLASLLASLLPASIGYLPFSHDFNAGGFLPSLLNITVLIIPVCLYLAAILSLYLTRVEQEKDVTTNRPLEIALAFFSGYGKFKELEHNLSEWENRHQLVLQNATDMILLLDLNGTIQDANAAAERILHLTAAELVGLNFFELSGIGSSITSEIDAKNPSLGVRRKIEMKLKDGATLALDMALSELRLRRQLMFLLVGRDITEETKMAAERTSLAEQVAHLQRLEALGRLTGGIAHDFNNYIHAILGHLDLLEMKYHPDNPELLSHLHKIGDVAEQAGNLTGQLLGFARKGKYQISVIDLRVLASRAMELFLPNRTQPVELNIETGDIPLEVKGDRIQLQQVMLNLLFNAFDAMKNNPPDRPPLLTLKTGKATESPVEAEPPRAVGNSSPPVDIAEYFYIMVRDNGCGMDMATLEHAFDPFFTTKPIGEGTGMGLPMVYGAITHHYGWVQIKSKIDFGTSVLLFLPTAAVTPKPIQAEVKL